MSPASGAVEVSVVLPAYNEAGTIERTVRTTVRTLAEFLPAGAFEVIVAEDGCEDRTPEIADRLAAEDPRVRHVHSDERLGRGGALDHAFAAAAGSTLVYFDTDLATDMDHLEELVERVRSGGYDVATGSRWLPGADADRPARRGVPSRAYNGLVRLFLRSELRDHQCGFKAVSRSAFEELRGEIGDEHWFWDTELLVRAQRRGYRVAEFPVAWEPKEDSKVDLVRDVLGMGSQILRTWWELSVRPRITPRRTVAAGLAVTVVALALMTLYIDPGEALAAFASADRGLVALAAAIYLCSWPIRGLRYRDVLAELGHDESVGFLTGAVFISQTGNLVVPARLGDAVRAYVVKLRRGVPYPTGFASLAAERVFDLLTIAALGGATLAGLVLTGNAGGLTAALSGSVPGVAPGAVRTAVRVAAGVGAVAVLAVAAVLAGARSERNLVRAAIGRLSSDSYAEYVARALERFVRDVERVAADRNAFVRVGAASLVVWGLDVVTAVVVLAAFPGVSLGPASLVVVGLFAVSVGNLAKVLPLSPGGVGLYEAAFTAFVVALTPAGAVPAAVAFAAAVLDHAVKNAVTVVGGVGSMLALNVSLVEAVEGGRSAAAADPSTED
jgi:uncharacterized protein (TIRG00374 family)